MTWSRAVGAVVWCALGAGWTGCGDADEPGAVVLTPVGSDAAEPDGASAPDADPPDVEPPPDAGPGGCPVTWHLDAAEAIGPGARIRVTAAPGADLAAVGPDGFAVYPADSADDWWVRAPYRGGVVELTVDARCPDGADETHRRAIAVRPLVWRSTPGWTPGEDGPLGREYFAMWLDPVDQQRLWVYGGFHYRPAQFTPSDDLWVRDLETGGWSAVEQAVAGPRAGGAGFTPLPGERVGIQLGGLASAGADTAFAVGLQRLDHAEPVAAWAAVPFERPVVGDYQPAVFPHPDGGRVLAVGGQGNFGAHLNGTWFALDGSDRGVVPVAEGGAPPGRVGFAWGHAGRRMVVFSGEQGGGGPACNCADDTWFMDLDARGVARWTRFEHPDQPPPRRNPVFGVDRDGQRLFVWGGTADGRTSVPGLSVLHFEPGGEAWVDVRVEPGADGPAPVRSSGRAVYDPRRQRMLFGFGNGDQGVRTDLWALDL